MSKKQSKKKTGGDKRTVQISEKAKRDRRTNRINIAITAVFLLVVLICTGYAQGIYLPWITALSAEDYAMNEVIFNYFYRDTYDSFLSAYGDIIEAYGTISSADLDEQEYSSGYTWAEFFYDTALSSAQRHVVVCLAAEDAGYELSDDAVKEVETEIETLKEASKQNGYVFVNRFLRSHYGKGATLRSYREYLLLQALANEFSGNYYSDVEFSDEDLVEWFAENYPDAGDEYDYNTVNFRLIYLAFSGYEYNEDTSSYEYSEETREDTMTQLELLTSSYMSADEEEQTEEAFAELAAACSSYLASSGGLYENAYKDDDGLESDVISWIFSISRVPGDTEYIEADSGVYLLYWVGEDIPTWEYLAQEGLRTEAWNVWYEELAAATEFDINDNILSYLYQES